MKSSLVKEKKESGRKENVMSGSIVIRGVEIGRGAPKVIVPIVSDTYKEIIAKARSLSAMDISTVEWRVDFYENSDDIDSVIGVIKELRCILGGKLILFTFRTEREGGQKSVSKEHYLALNTAAAQSGDVDMVDVEVFWGEEVARDNIGAIHAAGCLAVGSNHHFDSTPSSEFIVARLRSMQEMGVDIPKIAVMPKNNMDVLTLLAATAEMSEKYADRPIITISMDAKGTISRLACGAFGSSMTYGASGQASAPGQIPVDQLITALNILHNYSMAGNHV